MGTKKALIFGSMPCVDWAFLAPYQGWPDVVIAADGGLACAKAAGYQPTVYVGDNDSGGSAGAGMTAVPLEPEKDFTDLQAAYEWAVQTGCKDIIFTGCTGGRQDHQISAFQLLETAARAGIHGRILDPWNDIRFLLPGSYQFPQSGYQYFSLIPVDPLLKAVSISGAKYPLGGRDVSRGDSLTVSNEWSEAYVTISFQEGCCYFIQANSLT